MKTKGEPPTVDEITNAVLKMLSVEIGFPIKTSLEDRLRGAIVEAAMWIRQDAPQRALETLEQALQFKP